MGSHPEPHNCMGTCGKCLRHERRAGIEDAAKLIADAEDIKQARAILRAALLGKQGEPAGKVRMCSCGTPGCEKLPPEMPYSPEMAEKRRAAHARVMELSEEIRALEAQRPPEPTEVCGACGGSGEVLEENENENWLARCRPCRGTGRVRKEG